jgi:GTP diphosphokinase / guanosine-3',5'-bis(diphosphate) 3'-diphosphatase
MTDRKDCPDTGGTGASGEPDVADPEVVSSLWEAVDHRFGEAESTLVREAYDVAKRAHAGQCRASGEPYIVHPAEVAVLLARLDMDAATVAAGLLHDVVEDTKVTQKQVESRFGSEVAHLVEGLTKISAIEARQTPSEAEYLRRMLLAAVDDLRVIVIKMADRLHNMRTLDALSPERQRRVAHETLEIYAPLANRLGMWTFKSEFEDLALRVLEPEAFDAISLELADRRSQHNAYLTDAAAQLRAELEAQGIDATIRTRTKHLHSIYRKMIRKGAGAKQVYDVLAMRVIVGDVGQCYLALGVVHTLWTPIEGEFDDFIAKRKTNLYQSLHTTVLGPGNRPLEVQLRTKEMDEVAEYGLAAHWKYKENTKTDPEIEKKIAALRRLVRSQDQHAADAEAFVENLKTDVFKDQVYVFTPNAKVIELPAGSTPIDFAYRIHTEVGHRCRGATVDDALVALDTPLVTGQTVRIMTAKGAGGPSRDWLNPELGYVASSRARDAIRAWFRKQVRDQAVHDGRDLLDRQLRRLGITRVRHDDVCKLFAFDRVDDFLAAVGRSEIPAEAISAKLLEAYAAPTDRGAGTTTAASDGSHAPSRTGRLADSGIVMKGVNGLQTRAAACCHPLPGEDVLGYVTRGRGVTLHRSTCHNMVRLRDCEPDRFIRVHWSHTDEQAYPIHLQVSAYDRPALVRDITDVIARRGINMRSVSAAVDMPAGTAVVTIIVEIPSYAQLTGLIDRLAALDNVIDVHRPEG